MQRLSLQDPPDPAQVATVVEAVRGGALAVLPTETVYGLAADPDCPAAVARLAAVKGRDPAQPFTYHLADAGDLAAVAAPPPQRVRRLLARVWPGPLTVILPAAAGAPAAEVGVRVPAHPFTRQVLAAFDTGLFMTSVNRAGEPPIHQPAAILAEFGDDDGIAVLADAGEPRLQEASAILRLRGRRLEVIRPGILGEAELLVGAAAKVLFVCTGNTCRSPLAEVIARRLVAERLQIEPGEVMAHGLLFASAGTGTLPGMPASNGSVEAAREQGMDLAGHRSRALDPALVEAADRIYCLAPSHLADLLERAPAAADKATLLAPDGNPVPDPFGGSLATYRAIRDEIASHLRARLDELLALGD